MNRLCHRIVFNRVRDLLIAVAETVSSAGKRSHPKNSPSINRAKLAFTLKNLISVTWLSLAGHSIAAGGIVADSNAPANLRPSITNTANGLPQVNIQTPSAAGVSRNQYQQFDVSKAGAILNNATGSTSTQLGGWIQGNPNLSGGSARIILNEVNSNNPSQLRGFLEVAGRQAEVVVANAAGIICDGCGTINAGRMTLTTGHPLFGQSGSLSGYQVERGSINIEGAGWLAQGTEYADLIARAVQVNAGIWANNAQIVAGSNLVSADLQRITPLDNNQPAPAFAIDVAQLGGMYAGKIRLVATEAGVGVRNNGQLNAHDGLLSLNSAGQLTLSGSQYSSQTLNLQADGDIQHQGTSYSQGQLALHSKSAVQNTGTLAAQDSLTLQAVNLQSSGVLASGSNIQGQITSNGQLSLNAQQQIQLQQASIYSPELIIQTRGQLNTDQATLQAGNWQVDVGSLTNQQGLWQQWGNGSSYLTVQQSLNNQAGRIQANDLTLNTGLLNNQQGHINGQNHLALNLQQDYTVSQGETLSSQGELHLATSGILRNDSQWHNVGNLTLTAQSFSNTASLASGQRLTINSATTLSNLGRLDGDQVSLTADILDNQGMISGGQAQLNGRIIDNHGSQAVIAATDNLGLRASERISNRDQASIYSANTLELHSDDLIENISSTIEAEGDISIQAQHLDNRRSHVDIQREAEKTTSRWHKYHYYWRSLGMWVNTDRNSLAPTTKTLSVNNIEASKSQYGTIIGEPNLANNTVRIRYQNNKEINLNYQSIQKNADGSYNVSFYESKGGYGFMQGSPNDPYVQTVWREFRQGSQELWNPNIHTSAYDLDNITDYNNFRERSVTTVRSVDKLISAGQTASLHSGGNLTLNIGQRLLNDASRMTANGNLQIQGAGQVINQAYSINERVQETTVDHYDRDTVHWYPTRYTDTSTALQTIDSVIAGNQGVSINAPSVSNVTIESAQTPSSPEQPNLLAQLPNNGLFTQNPDPQAGYLIETDARFTHYGNFISSDYMLSRLGLDPTDIHKRLGDGYYEQKVVREQLLALTGRASAQGQSAMAEYQSLMNNALAVTQDFHLSIGVALTPEQISALQQDIVWMVSETVQTANGSQTVLVPKVYLASNTVRLTGDGAVIAGKDLSLSAQSLSNSGNLTASGILIAQADTLLHTGGLMQGSKVDLQANQLVLSTDLQNRARQAEISGDTIQLSGQNLTLQGAKITANQDLSLSASNNLSISTARSSYEGSVDVIAGHMGSRSTNLGGQVGGSGVAHITGRWEDALGSELNAKGNLTLTAGQDMQLIGSSAKAEGLTSAQAGNITIQADTTTSYSTLSANSARASVNASRQVDTLHASQLGGDARLLVIADQDLAVQGSALTSEQGQVLLSGKQVSLGTTLSHTQNHDRESFQGWLQTDSASTQVLGSLVSGQEGVIIQAREQDLSIQASTIQSEQGAIVLSAAQDVNILADYASEDFERHGQRTSKNFFSSKTTTTDQIDHQILAQGSTLSGESISITAGNNLQIQGSQLAATHDVDLLAGQDISITTATNSSSHYYDQQTKQSGLFGGGGIGFTIGKREQKDQSTDTLISHTGSTVGSILGNLNITAGKDLSVQGADLVAGQDIDLYAQNIRLTDVENRLQHTEKHEFSQSGLSVSLAGSVGSAVSNAVSQAQQSSEAKGDARLQALYGIQTGLSGYQAYQGYQQAVASEDGVGSSIGISVSLGSQKSQSKSYLTQTQSQGNQVTAGGNITLTATGSGGKDQAGYASDGDINVKGSQLQAGGDIVLDAARDITLEAGRNQQTLDGSNSSSGWSVGAALTFGNNTGLSFSLGVNKGQGREEGNGNNWNETTLNAGGELLLQSGRDTTLAGATASGETVIADIGRDLTLISLPDQDRYNYQQSSTSLGASLSLGAELSATLSASYNQQKIDSDFKSVQEQTGLYAGKGGFDITVGNHTQLSGAVIASTADPADNWLDTGTLGFNNLHNQADFQTQSQSAGWSLSSSLTQNLLSLAAANLGGGNRSESAESTTYAAVSDGTITVRDTQNQEQNVDDLSRDVEHAANGLNPIFDKEKELQRLQHAKLIGEIGMQVMDILRVEGEIDATKAAKEAASNPEKLNAAQAQLEKDGQSATAEEIYQHAYKTTYDAVMKGYGTGSSLQTAAQAITAALQGLAGGNLNAAMAGAATPYLAGVIKDITGDNAQANTFAHAVLGAVIAQIKGESALAGGAAAGAAPMIAQMLQEQLYPGIKTDALSDEQKQTLSALTTLAGSLAGGLITGDTAGALTGGQAAKNEVENNYLTSTLLSLKTALAHKKNRTVIEEAEYQTLLLQDALNDKKVIDACGGAPNSQACQVAREEAYAAAETYRNLTYQNLKEQQLGYQQIQALLDQTSKEGQEAFNLLEAYKQRFIDSGFSEDDAKRMAGAYIGSLYTAGGVSGILTFEALFKQPGVGVGNAQLSPKQLRLIKNAESISTAKKGTQSAAPRNLNEQIIWKQIQENPSLGESLPNMNTDPRFPAHAGFKKMQVSQKLSDGSTITIHYQYNHNTGKAYDMKITNIINATKGNTK